MPRRRLICLIVLAAAAPAAAYGQDGLTHPAPEGWFFGARAIAGASSADAGFSSEPAGLLDSERSSYNPQENFGGGAMLGYNFAIAEIPVRAELDGSVMYRHDSDVRADFAGGSEDYRNDLRIWDLHLSLLADVARWPWARAYVGAGAGAAFLESETLAVTGGETVDNSDWKPTASLQAGLLFDQVFENVDLELAYRFRWFGDTESGSFAGGERIAYEDVHIHEVMLGFAVPLGK